MKRIILFVLSLVMLLSIIGCTGTVNNNPAVNNTKKPADVTQKAVNYQYKYKVGDIIKFGSYEQDNKLNNGKEPIEWIVLSNEDGKTLLLSRYALFGLGHYDEWNSRSVLWEDSLSRRILNEHFIKDAFDDIERSQIQNTLVSADSNPFYPDVNPGNNTTDQVFLLSITELLKYFGWNEISKQCQGTEFAFNRKYYYYSKNYTYLNCYRYIFNGETFKNSLTRWWLRTPGKYGATFVYADADGSISFDGTIHDCYGVRPAMWVKF